MVSDIGLLPGFNELAMFIGRSLWVGLLVCWAITPGMMFLVALLFESRLLPLRPSKQLLSFFPGDLFLGIMVAGVVWSAARLPEGDRILGPMKVNSLVVQLAILGVVTAVAYAQHSSEVKAGVYPPRAVNSPTKIYHDVVLYVGYGYLAASSCIFNVVSHNWSALWWLLAGVPWIALVWWDTIHRNPKSAHVADWEPLWAPI